MPAKVEHWANLEAGGFGSGRERHRAARRIAGSDRTPYRYACGEAGIPEPAARLLRLLVLLRLTLSEPRFDDVMKQLD